MIRALSAALALLAAAAASHAQETNGPVRFEAASPPAATGSGEPTTAPAALTPGRRIDPGALRGMLGKRLETADGSAVGRIEDIIVRDGDRTEFVVSIGGLLGFGKRMVTIPYEEVVMSSDSLIVNMTEEQLRHAPEYDAETDPGSSLKGGDRR